MQRYPLSTRIGHTPSTHYSLPLLAAVHPGQELPQAVRLPQPGTTAPSPSRHTSPKFVGLRVRVEVGGRARWAAHVSLVEEQVCPVHSSDHVMQVVHPSPDATSKMKRNGERSRKNGSVRIVWPRSGSHSMGLNIDKIKKLHHNILASSGKRTTVGNRRRGEEKIRWLR